MRDDHVAEWKEEEEAPFRGWDFSHLHGRLVEEKPPWDYRALAGDVLRQAQVARAKPKWPYWTAKNLITELRATGFTIDDAHNWTGRWSTSGRRASSGTDHLPHGVEKRGGDLDAVPGLVL